MLLLSGPNMGGNEWKYVKDCLDTGWVSSVGAYVDQFEKMSAEFAGTKYAVATSSGTTALHICLVMLGVNADDYVITPKQITSINSAWELNLSTEEILMLVDTLTYLPEDVLMKVDRASMRHGLEVRVPFLDHKLFEFITTLPPKVRISPLGSKPMLRSLLYKQLPKSLVDRPKHGFSVPVGKWLRCELRDWAEDLLNKKSLQESGVEHADEIVSAWKRHQTGISSWQPMLWHAISYVSWFRNSKLVK